MRALVGSLICVTVLAGGVAPSAAAAARIDVTASFYPVAYAAERVGGGRVEVANLTQAGAEPHDLELTPKQIDAILDADVAFTMGHQFQPAVERAAAQRDRDAVTVSLLDALPIDAGDKQVDDDLKALDPHVWLDPVLMQDIVKQVRNALVKKDPDGRATYRRNARVFDTELRALDDRYRVGLASCARRLVVTSHEAFGYLARRYGLRQEGVVGLSPDTEPDARRLAQLVDRVADDGVTVVFTEALASPRIAETLARETGARTEVLNPIEGLTGSQIARSATYVTEMDENLTKLRSALGCT